MKPAQAPRAERDAARLLVIDPVLQTFSDRSVHDLPRLLNDGDLMVVNDAATLPASLPARSPSGGDMEIRLAQQLAGELWNAVLFGRGDWRIPTELRDPPETLRAGDKMVIGAGFIAEIVALSPLSDRLVTVRFNRSGPELWATLYAYGRPVQYSYHLADLPLWSVQTVYGGRPKSIEMPSAGQPLTWSILFALRRRGVKLARITHAAGLSSVGDEDLDAHLPFPEDYDIPQSTVDAVENARKRGNCVLAVGTTVVRALEGAAQNKNGVLAAGSGTTDLIIDKSFHPQIVSGILTGVHDPAQSHFRLLRAFAGERILRHAWRHAAEEGYLCHEFGDLCLILPRGS